MTTSWTSRELSVLRAAVGALGSESALAKRLGVNRSTVNRWLRGQSPVYAAMREEILSRARDYFDGKNQLTLK